MKFFQLFLCVTFITLSSGTAPYLVSIRQKGQQMIDTGFHLCNGAIIDKNFILTTASCTHFQATSTGILYPLSLNSIEIIAANSSIKREAISIDLAPRFNATTWENDLAIVQLNESLPLNASTGLQWIKLGMSDKFGYACSANFYQTMPNKEQMAPAHVMDEFFCNRGHNFTAEKRLDICSTYYLSPGTYCDNSWSTLRTSGDRGGSLVCDGKLFGLLSLIVEPQPGYNNSCLTERKFQAFYTKIPSYITWIGSKVQSINSVSTGNMYTVLPEIPFSTSATHPHMTTKPPKKNDAMSVTTTSLSNLLIISILFIMRQL